MVDEPKKSDKDEEQKSPATDRAEEIRAKIKEIEKERDFWMQRDDEEYKRYQSFEDRAGWTTRAKANKIRDDFFERMDSFRSFINDCNKRLETLNKELKNLVKEGIDDEDDEGPAGGHVGQSFDCEPEHFSVHRNDQRQSDDVGQLHRGRGHHPRCQGRMHT